MTRRNSNDRSKPCPENGFKSLYTWYAVRQLRSIQWRPARSFYLRSTHVDESPQGHPSHYRCIKTIACNPSRIAQCSVTRRVWLSRSPLYLTHGWVNPFSCAIRWCPADKPTSPEALIDIWHFSELPPWRKGLTTIAFAYFSPRRLPATTLWTRFVWPSFAFGPGVTRNQAPILRKKRKEQVFVTKHKYIKQYNLLRRKICNFVVI